jgi:5-oxoprolinase (ATP-hydrolysing) subunit A
MFNTVTVATVDLNADLAEGDHLSPVDLGVLDSITSVSLACGFHAGNRGVMRATAAAALERGVVVGAHVSYRDRDGFGRRDIEVSPAQLIDDIVEQWAVLDGEVRAVGGMVAFVKPHGALYNRMGRDPPVGDAVVEAVSRLDSRVLVAQSGTGLVGRGHTAGLQVVAEGFPDRGYLGDGALAPRGRPGALVDDPATAAQRAVSMVVHGGIAAVDGRWVSVAVETLCIHGDSPGAVETARQVRSALEAEAVTLRPFVVPQDSS